VIIGTLTLSETLSNGAALASFRSFVAKEHSEENLLFIEHVNRYRLMTPNDPSTLAAASYIWTQFLAPNDAAVTPVNIGDSTMVYLIHPSLEVS
jgi:hypothetical protein